MFRKSIPQSSTPPSPLEDRVSVTPDRNSPSRKSDTATGSFARKQRRRTPPRTTSSNQQSADPSPKSKNGQFGGLKPNPSVARALREMGYERPTPIQSAVIPLVRAGRDIVGQAQTGTGKTSAFGIPIVEMLKPSLREPQALILTPTRELAVQVNGEISKLGQFQEIQSLAVYGGQPMKYQLTALQGGIHLIIATPGRLQDHIDRGTINLSSLRIVVLDEADQMLDIGFAPDIERILRRTPRSRQTMLFSATMPTSIKRMVNRYLTNPAWIRVGGEAEPVEQVEQIYYEVAERDRSRALEKLLGEPGRIPQALIFRRTKIGVDKLVVYLNRRGYKAEAIHGDMPQSRRDKVMNGFRNRRLPILIATNVAARGLDIPAVSHVINYDMPSNLEEYVHRIGRTARMGRPGTAITFVSEWDFDTLDIIQAHIGNDLKQKRMASLYT